MIFMQRVRAVTMLCVFVGMAAGAQQRLGAR
jgi:hypothetical protein